MAITCFIRYEIDPVQLDELAHGTPLVPPDPMGRNSCRRAEVNDSRFGGARQNRQHILSVRE